MNDFPVRQFHINEIIFKEGSIGSSAYILKAGCVNIYTESSGKKVVLVALRPVTIFGEMSLLSKDHKRTATAEAIEYSEAVEIDKKSFDHYMAQTPPIIANVLNALADRLKSATSRVSSWAPDLCIGTCEMLNLLAGKDKDELPFETTVASISSIFSADAALIKDKLTGLEELNLLELNDNPKGEKIIRIIQKDKFLEKARNLQQKFNWKL